MFRSKTTQAVAEGGLFTIGMSLIVTGNTLIQKGDVMGGAIAILAGAIILVVSRYVHLPE